MSDFLTNVRKSRLLPSGQLDAWLAGLGETSLSEPADVAARMVADGLLTRFQADTLLEGRYRGFVLGGQYRLLDILARGVGRRLYVCLDTKRNRLVDLLVCHGFHGPEGSHERLKSAAKAIADLSHPHLCRVLEVRRSGEVPLVVLEHTDGTTLHQLVTRHGPMEPARAAAYVLQAAEGLQHAHDAGFRHGSLDAHDLLVDRVGVVRIIGVGLPQSHLKPAPVLSGPSTISLDTLNGQMADIAGLGSTLAFLITGQPAGAPLPESVPAGLRAVIEGLAGHGTAFHTAAEVADGLCPFAADPSPPPAAGELPAPQVSPAGTSHIAPMPVVVPRMPTPMSNSHLGGPLSTPPVTAMPASAPALSRPHRPMTDESSLVIPASMFPQGPKSAALGKAGVGMWLAIGSLVSGFVTLLIAVGVIAWMSGWFGGSSSTTSTKVELPTDAPKLDDGTPLLVRGVVKPFLGQKVAVLMSVQSVGGNTRLHLNSELNYRDADNVAVMFDTTQRTQLEQKFGDVSAVSAQYKNKSILARGTVETERDQLRLSVDAVEDVELLERCKPEQVREWVGKPAIVEFTVASVGQPGNRGRAYLNSEVDFKDEKNVSAMLTEKCMVRFRDRGVDPLSEYINKPVAVFGVVRLAGGRPQIEVAFPEQIQPVRK